MLTTSSYYRQQPAECVAPVYLDNSYGDPFSISPSLMFPQPLLTDIQLLSAAGFAFLYYSYN